MWESCIPAEQNWKDGIVWRGFSSGFLLAGWLPATSEVAAFQQSEHHTWFVVTGIVHSSVCQCTSSEPQEIPVCRAAYFRWRQSSVLFQSSACLWKQKCLKLLPPPSDSVHRCGWKSAVSSIGPLPFRFSPPPSFHFPLCRGKSSLARLWLAFSDHSSQSPSLALLPVYTEAGNSIIRSTSAFLMAAVTWQPWRKGVRT